MRNYLRSIGDPSFLIFNEKLKGSRRMFMTATLSAATQQVVRFLGCCRRNRRLPPTSANGRSTSRADQTAAVEKTPRTAEVADEHLPCPTRISSDQ